MSQQHFHDHPLIGKIVVLEDPTFNGARWKVSDVWIDIGAPDDAPRWCTVDIMDAGEEDWVYMTAADVEELLLKQA